MPKTFTPTVITAKKARKHIETIKARHNDIVMGITQQKMRVEAMQQQKAADAQVRAQMDGEQQKVKLEQQNKDRQEAMAHAKEIMANSVKMKELEIKRQALSQKD